MAIKYHQSKGAKTAGQLVKCRARSKACPNGGDEEHRFFNSAKEAREWSELSLAAQVGETLSPGQKLRLQELNELSDSLNPEKMVREEFGFDEYDGSSFRFREGLTSGELLEANRVLSEKFMTSRRSGRRIRDGRIEVRLADRYSHYYNVGIIAEDLVNGGYLYGEQSNGEFFVKRRSLALSEIIKVAADEKGFEPGEEIDAEGEEYRLVKSFGE